MNIDQLKEHFRKQLIAELDGWRETDPVCSYGSGMLLILSAIQRFDGQSIPMQVSAMHSVLRDIGEERGWGVTKSPGGDGQ